jgi:hypothetical protein
MSEKKERVFADGFSFKRNEDAPEYVIGRLSMKVEEAVAFMKKHANSNGWVNVSILYGRSGNPYVELDTYEPVKKDDGQEAKPAPKKAVAKAQAPEVDDEDENELPF